MTVLTVKDLKRAHSEPGHLRLKEFRQRLVTPPLSHGRFDIFLAHPGLGLSVLYRVVRTIDLMGYGVYIDTHTLNDTSCRVPGDDSLAFLKKMLGRCRCLLYVAPDESTLAPLSSWQLGYFDCLRGRAAVLPVLKKDTNRLGFSGRGVLGEYPFAAVARAMGEDHDSLWVMRDPKRHLDLEYWFSSPVDEL
jgi:hypothetical protein